MVPSVAAGEVHAPLVVPAGCTETGSAFERPAETVRFDLLDRALPPQILFNQPPCRSFRPVVGAAQRMLQTADVECSSQPRVEINRGWPSRGETAGMAGAWPRWGAFLAKLHKRLQGK